MVIHTDDPSFRPVWVGGYAPRLGHWNLFRPMARRANGSERFRYSSAVGGFLLTSCFVGLRRSFTSILLEIKLKVFHRPLSPLQWYTESRSLGFPGGKSSAGFSTAPPGQPIFLPRWIPLNSPETQRRRNPGYSIR